MNFRLSVSDRARRKFSRIGPDVNFSVFHPERRRANPISRKFKANATREIERERERRVPSANFFPACYSSTRVFFGLPCEGLERQTNEPTPTPTPTRRRDKIRFREWRRARCQRPELRSQIFRRNFRATANTDPWPNFHRLRRSTLSKGVVSFSRAWTRAKMTRRNSAIRSYYGWKTKSKLQICNNVGLTYVRCVGSSQLPRRWQRDWW